MQPEDQDNEEAEDEAEGGAGDLFHSHEVPERGQWEVEMINVLALDTGTKTGWAVYCNGMTDSGVQDFALKRGESVGMRFFLFRNWLNRMLYKFPVKLVIYEQAHHRGGAATMIGVGMVTRIQEECELHNVEYTPVHSATLKKFAVGHGKASKADMVRKAKERWPEQNIEDDNQADALWLLEYAKKEICDD